MFDTATWLLILRVVHVYAAIVLVGAIIFNTLILMPALRRIPPAHSAVVSEKIGGGLFYLGTSAIVLLGVTGFVRLWLVGLLGRFFTVDFLLNPYGRWIVLMAVAWLVLLVTGALSGIWYNTVLTKKLPYDSGLREMEEKRAAQERISRWQDNLAYVNLVFAILAALGGAMARYY